MTEILGQGETAPVGSADITWHCHRGKKQKTAPAEELHKKVPGVRMCCISTHSSILYFIFTLMTT